MAQPSPGDLARWGFLDAKKAAAAAMELEPLGSERAAQLTALCGRAADPDQAIKALAALVPCAEQLAQVLADEAARGRLIAILGASAELGQWLTRRPDELAVFLEPGQRVEAARISADLLAAVGLGTAGEPFDAASTSSQALPESGPTPDRKRENESHHPLPNDLQGSKSAPEVEREDAGSHQPLSNDVLRPQTATGTKPLSPEDALRQAYRRHVMRIAARDLTAPDPAAILEDITGELSDLADAVIQAALALAQTRVPKADLVRLAVIALGKTGAQELNYISDVDVLYVAEPTLDEAGQPVEVDATTVATRVVTTLMTIISGTTAAGTIWPIDANLRPEGAAGPLVRSLAAMERYYERWAENWEFQAMLKARPAAGDRQLGQDFVDLVSPLVWRAAQRPDFLSHSQAMRQRVVDHIPAKEADREIKLGRGGLRDTEFSVQLLQLVHGRNDQRLRLRATLPALRELTSHGYIGRADGATLNQAYRFQRLLEHRAQLWSLKRTHLMPEATDQPGLRRLARSVGLVSAADVTGRWQESTRQVRRLHQRVFYSPLLAAVSRIPTDEARLTPEAARDRLQALGYADPAAALRHIEALTTGLSRRAEIQRQLLPAMLSWIAEGPNPDMGLLAFRQVSDALGNTPFYLRALRDEGATAERLARVLSSSRYVGRLLLHEPASVELLAHPEIAPIKPRSVLVTEMTSVVSRHTGAGTTAGPVTAKSAATTDVAQVSSTRSETTSRTAPLEGHGPAASPEPTQRAGSPDPAAVQSAGAALQTVRRRELLRVAMSDLLAEADIRRVGRELSDITDASIEAALTVAQRLIPETPAMAIVALGRWGGGEMSYASDADLIYVVEDGADAAAMRQAAAVVTLMRRLLTTTGPDPGLELDADLRPEGKDGPIVRTLSSYRAYYDRWSSPWEAQALIRARIGAGQTDLGQAFLDIIDPLRYPDGGVGDDQLRQMRQLKSRMENERLPRGRARDHVKLGRGGLTDVEWTIQLFQLDQAYAVPGLKTTSTLGALAAAQEADLVTAEEAEALSQAWLLASRIRNAIMLLRDKASDALPTDSFQAAQVAELLGFGKGGASHLSETWGQTALKAKKVVDHRFWGEE
ncbi:MAG: bifunctional [glutamine synthetase] adenylyltransferase/[glutamine synthetase]-adenylyl-L-tyrosine phosphorylase [Propionibacteriaceae bacterium]|nr:bifunctional [glutamine synthetase] adenylyltransferase/[glutamine synthetase]-adenylyl-L-tyrosine phosphorylase [Propionibacteriaceae bacterium]